MVKMKTYFLNVGYGEATVIENNGSCIIIDGGPIVEPHFDGRISLIDFLKSIEIKKIDLIICTHIHYDHIAGLLAVALNYEIDTFLINLYSEMPSDVARSTFAHNNLTDNLFCVALSYYDKLIKTLKDKNITIKEVYALDEFSIYDLKITFYGLNREEAKKNKEDYEKMCISTDLDLIKTYDAHCNMTSLAMHISKLNLFLTGDLVCGYEKFELSQCDILKLTHHGQKDGLPQILLDKLKPKVFVICADSGKIYNSACDEILNRCEEYLSNNNLPNHTYITGLLPKKANTLLLLPVKSLSLTDSGKISHSHVISLTSPHT